jgi:cell division protease FtsH
MEQDSNTLRAQLAARSNRLEQVAAELKTELFGIDAVIDRVIESLRAWYVLPALISRPVIVCLWGLTGTGKTQLTRSLAKKLGFYDKFVEVQMDGFSNDSGYRASTISGMLGESGIEEGAPGILVLDEFQRYRTVDGDGDDVKVERYMDVWTLLSDGRLPPALSFMNELEMSLAGSYYSQQRRQERGRDDDDAGKPPAKFSLSPHEASEFKQTLKLKEPILQIMGWTAQDIHVRMQAFRDSQVHWETNYSQLLVFVCGNLDEMYEDTARRVEDCDTDADIFHALTSRMSIIDVKRALSERFKPEQIARLGNNHVIYPSFSRATYQKLISVTVVRYLADMQASSGLCFAVTPALKDEIYNNAVFPAQGTRPLFSSIHALLSAPLVSSALWALENGAIRGDALTMDVDATQSQLVTRFGTLTQRWPVNLELNRLKQRTDPDFRALLAVHEAGHGLVYALLFGQPPQELKINVATFAGGYNNYERPKALSKRNLQDTVCVSLAGRAAEAMVFGDAACTSGAEGDLKRATAVAAQYVRHYGFAKHLSRRDVATDAGENLNTEVQPSNPLIEELLQQQYARAQGLLLNNASIFMRITQALTCEGEVSQEALAQWLGLTLRRDIGVLEPYAHLLSQFAGRQNVMQNRPLLAA